MVKSIHITETAGGAPIEVAYAIAIPGLGLEGDRYASGIGRWSDEPTDHELTLIAQETIDSIAAEHGVVLAPGKMRRNITTVGVELKRLVGKRFLIGEVLCVETRPGGSLWIFGENHGCPGLARLLAGRGGLRAMILSEGVIFVGDTVRDADPRI